MSVYVLETNDQLSALLMTKQMPTREFHMIDLADGYRE